MQYAYYAYAVLCVTLRFCTSCFVGMSVHLLVRGNDGRLRRVYFVNIDTTTKK